MGWLFATIKWAIGLIVLTGVVWFTVWIIRHRSSWHISVSVEYASLTRFDIDSNSTLHYNLALKLSVRNANRATVHYHKINATALYNGSLFCAMDVPTFTQGHMTTTMIYPVFQGQASIPSDSLLMSVFNQEKKEEFYSIGIKIFTNIEIEWISWSRRGRHTHHYKRYVPEANCALRVPRADGANTGAVFNRTICDVKF